MCVRSAEVSSKLHAALCRCGRFGNGTPTELLVVNKNENHTREKLVFDGIKTGKLATEIALKLLRSTSNLEGSRVNKKSVIFDPTKYVGALLGL